MGLCQGCGRAVDGTVQTLTDCHEETTMTIPVEYSDFLVRSLSKIEIRVPLGLKVALEEMVKHADESYVKISTKSHRGCNYHHSLQSRRLATVVW